MDLDDYRLLIAGDQTDPHERWWAIFPAKLTSRALTAGGVYLYGWVEREVIPESGLFRDGPAPRRGSAFVWAGALTPSATDTGTEVLTFTDPTGWQTGWVVYPNATIGGITAGVTYYYRALTTTTGSLHTTLAGSVADTGKVNLTASVTAALSGYDRSALLGSSVPSSTDTGAETLTFSTTPGWLTGSAIYTATTGGGITAGVTYYYHAATTTTGSLHTTLVDALAGTNKVNLTASIVATLTGYALESAISPAYELNGRAVDVLSEPNVWLRFRAIVNGQVTWDFDCCPPGDSVPSTATAPQLTADQNDYAPPDGAEILYMSSDGSRAVTGLNLAAGRKITVVVTAGTITWPDGSTGSAAAHRLDIPGGGTVSLAPGDSAAFVENGTNVSMVETTGKISRPQQTYTATGTQLDDFAVDPNVDEIVFTTNSATSVTGFADPGSPGRPISVANKSTSAATLTVTHDDPSSLVTSRVDSPTLTSIELPPGKSLAIARRTTLGKWTPTLSLDRIPWRPTLSTTQNNLPIPIGALSLEPVLTTGVTITGLAKLPRGMPFMIHNPSTNSDSLTLPHNSASSSSGNKFEWSGLADIVLSPGKGLTVIYDGASIRDIGGSLSLAGSAGGAVTGSGTIGTLPKFVGATLIGDSIISESGGNITIDGTLDVDAIDVVGILDALTIYATTAYFIGGVGGGTAVTGGLTFVGGLYLSGTAPVLSGTGAPAAGLGSPGSIYLDIADPSNPQLFYKD